MLTQKDYSQAYVEVLEVLKNMNKDDVKKLPEELIKEFKEKKDLQYTFKYDRSKKVKEQNLSDVAKAILSNLYTKYWATEYERKVILAKQRANRIEAERQKSLNFKKNSLFGNN